ncbi:glycosyltransferase, partial [Patescibacteria group bacterium]|nr:glycosyltransferase [Patescibacteria group bacterium]
HPELVSGSLPRQSFYLTGGRLARAKRYDLAIKACNQLKLPLKIFGRDFAGHEAELKKIACPATAGAGPTTEFLGEITNQQKSELMSTAKAFIFCSDNEDFGIVPVEAMSYGCPVIGHRSGGTAETVIDGKTGILFDDLTVPSLVSAIKKFQKIYHPEFTCPATARISGSLSKACRSRAQQFSSAVFTKKIEKLVSAL